jgi:hypothetical protein
MLALERVHSTSNESSACRRRFEIIPIFRVHARAPARFCPAPSAAATLASPPARHRLFSNARQIALGGLACALSSAGAIPEAFLALLSRGKSKGEPAYGALGVRHFGMLHQVGSVGLVASAEMLRQRRPPSRSGTVAGWQVAHRPGRATISVEARSHHADPAPRRETGSCQYRCRSGRLRRHGVLLVFAAPSQLLSLVGLEHGRTSAARLAAIPAGGSPANRGVQTLL